MLSSMSRQRLSLKKVSEKVSLRRKYHFYVICYNLPSFNILPVYNWQLYTLPQKHDADDRRKRVRVAYERKDRMLLGGSPYSCTMESLLEWWHIVISRRPGPAHAQSTLLRCCQHSNVRRPTVEMHHEPTSQRTTTTTHYKLITDGAESMSTLIIRRRTRATCNYGRKFHTVATNTI